MIVGAVVGLAAAPVGAAGVQNAALAGKARQSSVAQGGAASRAIDGKLDGVFANGSVALTAKEKGPWWEVDLGAERLVQAIELGNRSDCCGAQLAGAVVELRGKPCDWDSKEVRASQVVGAEPGATVKLAFEPGSYARWVCVRHTREESLGLAEVAVWATPLARPVVRNGAPAELPAPLPPTPAPAPPTVKPPMAASVIATVGQVVYVGVDNPVTVRVPGSAAEDLELTATCPFTGKAGEYVLRPASGTVCGVSVGVRSAGVVVPAGQVDVAVRRIPDPAVYVGNIKGDGQITKAELQSQAGLFARMEGFPIAVNFTVVSFVMVMNINGVDVEKQANGPGLTPEMRSMLGGARAGMRVIFERVTVQGPDGTLRKVPGVVLKVK